jgi:uncharacterized Zn finger protein
MDKYMSCPLCGAPEPEQLGQGPDITFPLWLLQCFDCGHVVRVEDITAMYNQLDREAIGNNAEEMT